KRLSRRRTARRPPEAQYRKRRHRLKALRDAICMYLETVAETNAAQTQKKAIRCNDPKGRRGVFVQTTKPMVAPAASTTQRAEVHVPCMGTCMPAQRKAITSRTKKR